MKSYVLSVLALLCIATSPLLRADNLVDENMWQYRATCEEIEDSLIEIESKIDELSEQITEDGSMIEVILSKVCIIETVLDGLTS